MKKKIKTQQYLTDNINKNIAEAMHIIIISTVE